MKGKKIFELPLDGNAKLIVYIDRDYDNVYFDSWLYFFDGKRERLLVNDSLAFHIGMHLYKRSFCINDFVGIDFENELVECKLSERYDRIGKLFEITECVNHDMYLFRQNGKVKFLLNKLKIESNEREKLTTVKRKKLYEAEISEATIALWQEILEKEFVPKYIAELKKSEHITTEEQVQQAINSMKNK